MRIKLVNIAVDIFVLLFWLPGAEW